LAGGVVGFAGCADRGFGAARRGAALVAGLLVRGAEDGDTARVVSAAGAVTAGAGFWVVVGVAAGACCIPSMFVAPAAGAGAAVPGVWE
jgi:hypothetical protein